MYCTRRINDDYTWVGADGRRLAMFEGVFDVPAGISFNSYLLRDEKTVLFDTTDAAVRRTFRENLLHALEGRSLDCVVVHHMEPDHTAELEELVLRFPEVQIYCSAMAKTMMTQFFGPGFQERIHVVKEGDTLCTGRHTLRFIAAPMVHWPEVMVSYDAADHILFSAADSQCRRVCEHHQRKTRAGRCIFQKFCQICLCGIKTAFFHIRRLHAQRAVQTNDIIPHLYFSHKIRTG